LKKKLKIEIRDGEELKKARRFKVKRQNVYNYLKKLILK